MRQRVVITGLGAVSPCGLDVPTTWDAMVNARSGLGPLTRFDVTGQACQIAGEVKGFDDEALLGPRKVRRLGQFMKYAMVASDEAMRDAGYDMAHIDGGSGTGHWPNQDEFGVYIGSGVGGFPELVAGHEQVLREGMKRMSPFHIPRSLVNIAAGQVAIRFGARGPSLCVATACAVGNHAIGEAYRAICYGDAEVIAAGGAEAGLSPSGFAGFMNMRALSRRNDEPERASRPFDRDRDGFVMSEGSGIVILETLEHALARGARIYCEIVGYGATTDAFHVTAPAPGGAGAARCMAKAMRDAGLDAESVDYINAHGTSTPANDSAETAAIRKVFGPAADSLVVSSTKGVTGHLLGAAGGIEAIATAKALQTGIVPPTANLDNADPECDLDYVPNEARQVNPTVALSNAFGFGGTNAVLAFKKWEP